MTALGIIIALLLIFAGLVLLLGFWPVTLILVGLALLVWFLSRN